MRVKTKMKSTRRPPTEFDALVRWRPPCAIHDEVSYGNTQETIDLLTSIPDPTAEQLRYLDTITTLFEAYENERHALDAEKLSPVELLRELMEARDMTASDLGRLLGERSLGSKILSGERELSKTHIRTLARHFNVNAGLLL